MDNDSGYLSDDVVDMIDNIIEGGEDTPVEEPSEAVEEAPEVTEEPVEEPEEVPEGELQDETPVAAEEPTEPSEETTEGSDDPYEKRYKDLQSWADKRDAERKSELDKMRGELDAYQKQMQELFSYEEEPEPVHVSDEDLEGGIEVNPIGTVEWALTNNRMDLLPKITSGIRAKHGDELAEQVNHGISEMRLAQQQAQMEAQYQQMVAPQIVQQQVQGAVDHVRQADPEGFDANSARITEIMKTTVPKDARPENLHFYVQSAYQQARLESFENKKAEAERQPRELKPQEQVEAGSPGSTPPPATDSETVVGELAEAFKGLNALPE